MKKGDFRERFSKHQILKINREVESSWTVKDIYREYGISDTTCYTWKVKYADLTISELKILKSL